MGAITGLRDMHPYYTIHTQYNIFEPSEQLPIGVLSRVGVEIYTHRDSTLFLSIK